MIYSPFSVKNNDSNDDDDDSDDGDVDDKTQGCGDDDKDYGYDVMSDMIIVIL